MSDSGCSGSVVLKKWDSVQLGLYRPPMEYVSRLEGMGVMIASSAREVLLKMQITSVVRTVELFLGSAYDFGFTHRRQVEFGEIVIEAGRHGYSVCPAEVGPAVCIRYATNQSDIVEGLRVAMAPIMDSSDCPTIFGIEVGDALWLSASRGHSDSMYFVDAVWIWSRRKS
jgi:hypothetical protein